MPSPPRSRLLPVTATLILIAAVAVALRAWLPRKANSRPPDIVLIVWDTCRADRLSTAGHDRPTSPWLEKFAAGGVAFDRCFAPAPWTAPSHGSLFTGLMPSKHGLRIGRGDRVRRDIPVLAETLAAAGYDTVGVTANPHVSALTGLDRGFRLFTKAYETEKAKPPASVTAKAARDTLDPVLQEGRKPLFLFVNFLDPHMPHAPGADAVAAVRPPGVTDADLAAARSLSPDLDLTLPLGAPPLREGETVGLRTLYDADVRTMDGETGALLDWLASRGLGKDALVVVVGDHGEDLGERGHAGHRLSLYDTVLHVPLVLRWPGRFEGGRRSGAMVSLMDLYPLLLEASGVPVPEGTGRDAVTLAESGKGGRVLLAEHGPNHAFLGPVKAMFPGLRDEAFEPVRWMFQSARTREEGSERKLLRILRNDGKGGPWTPVRTEYYDTTADPREERDLLEGGDPAVMAAARALEKSLPPPTMPSLPR